MISTLALSLALFVPQWAPGDPEPGPSADETLGLEWVNRFRADPAGEGALLMEREFPREAFPGFDREMYLAEIALLKPVPPVFFNPRLIAAARNHASYTVLNSANQEFGHKEIEGHAGFTGEWPHQRAEAVGYEGRVGESAVAYCRGGIYGNHWGNIVDDGPGGKGGMQPGRGHRALTIDARYREFGMGNVIREDGRQDIAQVYGEGSGGRLIGGVAYLDLDGDGFYDVGEGLGGVHISPGTVRGDPFRQSTFTWSSGAYVFKAGSSKALNLRATLYDLEFKGKAPAGEANHKFDIEMRQAILDHWSKLLTKQNAKLAKTPKRAAENLAFWTHRVPQLQPPSPLPQDVLDLRKRWQATSKAALDKLAKGEPCPEELRDLANLHRGSLMGDWYGDADRLSNLVKRMRQLEQSNGSASTKKRKGRRLIVEVFDFQETTQHPDLRESSGWRLALHSALTETQARR
ncbi:MAG: hypothetical protein P1V35_17285 [Planctomycetota bacterium]|nr:hypothetical protein [Planctomycetota bacterium]